MRRLPNLNKFTKRSLFNLTVKGPAKAASSRAPLTCWGAKLSKVAKAIYLQEALCFRGDFNTSMSQRAEATWQRRE